MVYADTSVLASLSMNDFHSGRAVELVSKRRENLVFTDLLRVEVGNAIRLAVAPGRMNEDEATISRARVEAFESEGAWIFCEVDWKRVFRRSIGLSLSHSAEIRNRTLDILHVSSAMEMGVREFWTFDKKQKALAEGVGLRVNP